MTASDIIKSYVSFFEKRGHKRINNAPLVPQNDPTTLFINSGMQPLVPYLLGETHPLGQRLVDVQNCFRAQDIDEVGDNRHITLFRMLGNWSLGDYFKTEQLPWFFEFLTKELGLLPERLYVTVFQGFNDIPKDREASVIWTELFESVGIDPTNRIFYYGTSKNWWSRAGEPQNMPVGEPGGPSSEVFYDFETVHDTKFGRNCHVNCDCGRYIEIGNSVFMEYVKEAGGSLTELPKKNVDFGGGLERLLMAVEHQPDIFKTSQFLPIITAIEKQLQKKYDENAKEMRIVTSHLISASFIANAGVRPANKDQGYLLRRLIRRAMDGFSQLSGKDISPVIEAIVAQYKDTDPDLAKNFAAVKNTILEESLAYTRTQSEAKKFIQKRYQKQGDELMGIVEISADDAFTLYTTHGLSPTQIKSLGYTFDDRAFALKMEEHQKLSRLGAEKKFSGGLADHQEKTVMGHTATHLLHQAVRDLLGTKVHQSGSNITDERLRFDFNYDEKLTDEQIKSLEDTVNQKIKENLPVRFEMIPTEVAKKMGAIGLFSDTYADISKIYFIGGSSKERDLVYSIEFCGGPHVNFTGELKSFTIIKQENMGNGLRRIYAVVGN